MTNNRKTETFLIGKNSFISPSWSPLKAAKKLPPIGKSFAVPISFIFSAAQSGDYSSAIPQAMYMLFEQLEEQDISNLFKTILEDVWCKESNRAVNLDEDLDNLDELLTLVASVLNQHYGCLIAGKGFMALFQVMVPLHQLQA
jgi:hypothetical protein